MAVALKLAACIDDCETLSIYDNTLQNSSTNIGGWNFDNPDPSESTSSYLVITFPDNTTETITLDTATQPTTVTTKFLLASIPLVGNGKYIIKYYVNVIDSEDNPGVRFTRTTCTTIYNLCSLRCCIDKMWIKALNSDCKCTNSNTSVLEAEALYRLALSATGSLNDATRDKLISKLERICKLADCKCQ